MGSQEWGGKAQGSSLSCGSGHDRAMWSPRAKEHRNNLWATIPIGTMKQDNPGHWSYGTVGKQMATVAVLENSGSHRKSHKCW